MHKFKLQRVKMCDISADLQVIPPPKKEAFAFKLQHPLGKFQPALPYVKFSYREKIEVVKASNNLVPNEVSTNY